MAFADSDSSVDAEASSDRMHWHRPAGDTLDGLTRVVVVAVVVVAVVVVVVVVVLVTVYRRCSTRCLQQFGKHIALLQLFTSCCCSICLSIYTYIRTFMHT